MGGNPNWNILVHLLVLCSCFIQNGCDRPVRNLSVCEIQGPASISPHLGSAVIIEGIISADFSVHDPAGFYLQGYCIEKNVFRGIWINLDDRVEWLNQGDEIRLVGTVEELNLETIIQAKSGSIEILSLANGISEPVNLADKYNLDPLSFRYEDWEGDWVHLPESTVIFHQTEGDELLVCPVFSERFTNQNGCFLGQNFYLGLKGALKHPGLSTAGPWDQISNITGILRQETAGYFIQILDLASIRLRKPALAASHLIGVSPELDLDEIPVDLKREPGGPATPTKSNTWKPVSTATLLPSPTYYPVNLLLTEVHPNPAGAEPELEWVEIYNPGAHGIPLTGIKVGDETSPDGREGTLQFPDGYMIPAGGVKVIANHASAFFSEYGFYPDFEINSSLSRVPDLLPYPGWGGSKLQFSNSGDELILIDPWDRIIDQLAYGRSTWGLFSPPVAAPREGNSLERYPPGHDSDTAEDWRERQGGSPGWLDRSLPTTAASLTFSPSASLTPSPSSSITDTPENIPSLTISPTSSATTQSAGSPTGDITPSRTQTGTFPAGTLTPPILTSPVTPSQTTSFLTSTASATVTPPNIVPGTPTVLPPTPGETETISITATNHISETALPQISSTPILVTLTPPSLSATPSLVPAASPSPDLAPGRIVINEIHADPDPDLGDANADGEVHSDDDEFLEFVNTGGTSLDLSEWQVSDLITTRFVFPAGTLLEPGCGLVLFGGDVPDSWFGGSQVFSTGSLGLNNSGDTIFVIDQELKTHLTLSYGPEGGNNQSLTLFPDLEELLPHQLHGGLVEAEGRLFSPGTRLDGSNFDQCP